MTHTFRLQQLLVPLVGTILVIGALLVPSTKIAYGVTLLLALFAFMLPKQAILFLLMYFPVRSFLVEVNPGLKLIGDVVIVVAFLRVVWDARSNPKSLFSFAVYEWAFIAFLLVGSIGAYLNDVYIAAIVFQLRAFAITFLLVYIVKRLEITKADIRNFLILTVVMAVVLALQGLVEKLSMRSLLMPENWVNRQLSPNNASRIYGLANNPNVLAVYFTIAGILAYYLKKLVQKTSVQWLLNIALVLLAGAWILTYSRGTWIALAVGLGVYFIFTFNWRFIAKTILVAVLGFGLVTVPVTYGTKWISNNTTIGDFERTGVTEAEGGFAVESSRIKETFNTSTLEKSKTTGRLFLVYKGLEIFKDYPIIGSGFATFGDSASKSYSSPLYAHYNILVDIYSDNQYIQVIAQTGVVGVLLFAVFLLSMVVVLWKKRKESPSALPMLAALIAIFWCGLIYNIWEDKIFTMYFYILIAAVASSQTLKQKYKLS